MSDSNVTQHPNTLTEESIADLLDSALRPEDMKVRNAGMPELAAIGIQGSTTGYVIPYFNIYGKQIPFYRVKLFNSPVKYKQPKQTANHVYFPPGIQDLMKEKPEYIIICEGEKKAAAAVKHGFPCVGLGGVDSWKNRTVILPAATDLARTNYSTKDIAAKLPTGEGDLLENAGTILAVGMMELIDYCVSKRVHVIVAFDSDTSGGIKFEVQRAASNLAFELRYRGIAFDHIHQVMLPPNPQHPDKLGLDDFLIREGKEKFDGLISKVLASHYSFPRHPNIREYINRKMSRTKMSRKEAQQVAMAILSDLDANGRRLRSVDEHQMYYFDNMSRKLISASFNTHNKGQIHETAFGQHLYRVYGISAADTRMITWLDAQFNAEEPVEEVSPHRVIARHVPGDDSVRIQINDGQYVRVSADEEEPIEIHDNGDNGILFISDQVKEIDAGDLQTEFRTIEAEYAKTGKMDCWWKDVLDDVRLKKTDRSKEILTLLYYMAPFLARWRGMQLPVELVIGEPGSGKSSLCEHRLNVITGESELRNAPTDLKDWHASISNTGGLHVTDNVHLVDRNLRQRLSDEICRIITEPKPHVEQRKLYSNNELMRIPVSCIFAITAIQQPFQNADIIQRSIITELDKMAKQSDDNDMVTYEGDWVGEQMKRFGGRTRWMAHHLFVLHRFFKLVEEQWNTKYIAQHRLIHMEQGLTVMAKVFGFDGDWIPDYLSSTTTRAVSKSDWALEGLAAFVKVKKLQHGKEIDTMRFAAQDIASWAIVQEDFQENTQITNSRSLGRYIQTHKHLITQACGIVEDGKKNNKVVYRIL